MKRTGKPARSPQLLAAVLLALPGLALANADLKSKMDNPGNWAAQAGDFYNQRYSKLDQINKDNVGKTCRSRGPLHRRCCAAMKARRW